MRKINMAWAVSAVLVLLLTACGGDNSSPITTANAQAASSPAISNIALPASSPEQASAPTSASAPDAASTPVVQIAAYGDDAMEGVTMNGWMFSLVTPNEPADLQAALQSQFSDTGITVADDATGGTASSLKNELAGTDGGGAPFAQRVAVNPAAIIIDNHAVNDALGGETVNDYAGYLGQWIQDVRSAGKTPVLEEPGPVCDGNHPQLPQYVEAMDEAAQQYGVPLIQEYAQIQAIPDWCSHMVQGFYPDATIDAAKAQQEEAVIAPLVKAIGRLG